MLTVFVLYVRCTRINPADPGIMSKFGSEFNYVAKNSFDLKDRGLPSSPRNTAVIHCLLCCQIVGSPKIFMSIE